MEKLHPQLLTVSRYTDDYSLNYDEFLSHLRLGKGTEYLIDKIIFTKSSHWKEENEYRIIQHLNNAENARLFPSTMSEIDNNIYLYPFDIKSIENIIIGVNTPKSIKEFIFEISQKNGIGLRQAIIFRDENINMGFMEINNENIDVVYEGHPTAWVLDANDVDPASNSKEKVRTKEEIPFYDSIKDIIDSYLAGEKFSL